jgi:hypothetical protein
MSLCCNKSQESLVCRFLFAWRLRLPVNKVEVLLFHGWPLSCWDLSLPIVMCQAHLFSMVYCENCLFLCGPLFSYDSVSQDDSCLHALVPLVVEYRFV